jgi:hypothetical protein
MSSRNFPFKPGLPMASWVGAWLVKNRLLNASNKLAPLPVRVGACIASLVVSFSFLPAVWASLDEPGNQSPNTIAAGPAGTQNVSYKQINGKLDNAADMQAKIAIAAETESGKPTDLVVGPQTTIILNGMPARVGELKPGDDIKVSVDDKGQTVSVDARRTRPGIVLNVDNNHVVLTTDYLDHFAYDMPAGTKLLINGKDAQISELQRGDAVGIVADKNDHVLQASVKRSSFLNEFLTNFQKNLFKPLLLFFYLGFSIPLLKIAFEFPNAVYQGLTIYLLISIGWKGGEELAVLSGGELAQALKFIGVGFCTNTVIGIATYFMLRKFIPRMRKIDAATVSAYYGSDSAGTFVTCLGVLQAAHIAYAAYMPVMLASMEIPGCLVGLYLVSRLRRTGMDVHGNMPDEPGYDGDTVPGNYVTSELEHETMVVAESIAQPIEMKEPVGAGVSQGARSAVAFRAQGTATAVRASGTGYGEQTGGGNGGSDRPQTPVKSDLHKFIPGHAPHHAHEGYGHGGEGSAKGTGELLREVFFNPGIALLFGGIMIGFISKHQGNAVVQADDQLFVSLFQGMLCLFLLEMGMTASKRLQDLKTASWKFIAFGLLAPNLFAVFGMSVACIFSHAINQPLQLGTYVLFAVLCAAASYIAVPAIQRLAIPEASPTLPLAASLGLTFSYNVTIGISLYLVIAQQLIRAFPVVN